MIDYLNDKENLYLEYKEAYLKIPNNFWESYSSFSNTAGGTIVLGIKENKGTKNEIIGVKDPEKLKTDFFNVLNNRNKINYNHLKDDCFEIVKVGDKKIIVITIKECSRTEKPIYLNGNLSETYKRNFEGDYKCTNNEILAMLEDSKLETFDSSLNKFGYGYKSINIESLKLYKSIMNQYNPNNIFYNLEDKDFLQKLGFAREDNGILKLTNAAVLLFTNQNIIKSIYPNYFIDFKEVNDSVDSWTYRITSDDLSTPGNLIIMYNNILKRLLKDIPNPFALDGIQESSNKLFAFIMRESLANAIINCDYFLETGINIIKTLSNISFINIGRLKVGIKQAINGGKSMPRNPNIMLALRNVGLCERGGTGIPRIFTSCKKLNLFEPQLYENNEFNTTNLIISLQNDVSNHTIYVEKLIISYLSKHPEGGSINDLIEFTNYKKTTISTTLSRLVSDNKIKTNKKLTNGKLFYLK